MKEIKFRAWDTALNHWDNHPQNAIRLDGKLFFGNADISGYPLLIEQFTGLHDMNGKWIFEGDIIRCDNCLHDRFAPFEVKFENGIFGVRNSNGPLTPVYVFGEWCHLEVVGNVHENPELLVRL